MGKRKKLLREILLLVAVVILGVLIASGIIWANDFGEADRENGRFQVKTSVDDVTPVSLHITIENLVTRSGPPGELCILPDGLIVEKPTIFGWKEVKKTEGARRVSDLMIRPLLDENEKQDYTVHWIYLYEKLQKGTYRIGLPIYSHTQYADDEYLGYCYATFKVTE